MTEQEEYWFNALTRDRSDSASTLEKPSMRGIQRSVVDKYSDQAHFVYELLQNADDVKATSAHFRLDENGLYFIHNGSVRFTVSNPETEDSDTSSGTLGHINSITSIANSNKTAASIGKFGVGFKAIFQYTKTPHIYDPNIHFKIERFIVPQLLDRDLDWRNATDTVFWFPFDHKLKSPEVCFEDILEKLKTLDYPLLFLSHLNYVGFEGGVVSGKYTQKVKKLCDHKCTTVQRVTATLNINGRNTTQRFLTASRRGVDELRYCIGYALRADGKLEPIHRPAYCFFPTKEVTNLNFILHAPFLLTDSREGIKAGEKHNEELIQQLSQLVADSLPILRDEGLIDDAILNIIPYEEEKFSELEDRRKISFKPIYTSIAQKLKTDSLLPAGDGECSEKHRSYWAADTELVELFSDKQLALLTGTKNARWVFRSRGKKDVQNSNRALADYIDGGDARAWAQKESNLIISSLDPEVVLKKINADFISAQPQKWLHKFYSYLSERASYQKFVKTSPIFLDQAGKAVAAFDGREQHVLFLPDDDIAGCATVNRGLLSNKATREFIEKFGVKKPSLRDEIYNNILPAYKTDGGLDTNPHFSTFFRYFKECRHEEVAEFIELIRDKQFLRCTKTGDPTVYRDTPMNLYLPTPDLRAWFASKHDAKFLTLDEYHRLVDVKDHRKLEEFLERLGVEKAPRVTSCEIPKKSEVLKGQALIRRGTKHRFQDSVLDGCEQIITNIDAEKSVLLWHFLVNKVRLDSLKGLHTWLCFGKQEECFESTEAQRLLRAEWILNTNGELVATNDVTVQTLSADYDTTSDGALALIKFLKIRDEADDTSHLNEEEARIVLLAKEIEKSGLSVDEARIAFAAFTRRKAIPALMDKDEDNIEPDPSFSPLIRDIENRRSSVKNPDSSGRPLFTSLEQSDESEDADEYVPRTVDYGKKLDGVKDRYASELDRIEREQALNEKVNAAPRYSYGWFLALLELECLASSEKSADSRTISISFGRVERDARSSKTIVLKKPSRFIPQSMEEMSCVRVDLDFGNGRTGKLRVESFTAREFSLLGKVESERELNGIALEDVLEARIVVQNPSFLLEELLQRYRELRFEENFDMKGNLTPDIEFVFGPPGTGKTTHLAENVLIPKMLGTGRARVLVLTPTNKAADVLTARIMDKMGGDTSYAGWLIRFGTSADERIENAGVWRDRSFDIATLTRSVTVTTIARFAYDGFAGQHGMKLHEMEWDAIVVDEASMVSLAHIIYPLYRVKPQKFIIAGDPFQIEPIVAVEQWKDENIYTLVGLNKAGSFANPVTKPYGYPVINLEVQYRSIPAIGEVFSSFTYDGILKHHRETGAQRPLKLSGFEAKPINLIKFPVSRYESIYRAKRLASGTPYQTYSALFTFEFVRWLAVQIMGDLSDKVRIGVIAPYRAQANLVSKLNDSWGTKPDAVEIQVGTIHGFQGDECDIVIAVFNPPPAISSDPRMFLNRQNILNVAISRARDYLFIIMPDRDTEGVQNLHRITKIENLVRAGGAFGECTSRAIEKVIWGHSNYLEENTFSTGHQMVNVYRKPERYYEVRSDDSAIDVQIHERIPDGQG